MNFYLKSVLMFALIGIMGVTQTPTYAQLGGLLKKKSNDSGGATISKDALGKSTDEALENVLAARIVLLAAKKLMMEAVGVKTDSVVKASEALQAKSGSTSEKVKTLETSSKTTAAADKEFEEKMASSKELSAESKIKFSEGTAKFVEGILLEKKQIETIIQLVKQGQSLVQSASPLEKVGVLSMVKPLTTMSTAVPGDVKEGMATLSKITAFAKNQKISVPSAEKATSGVGEL